MLIAEKRKQKIIVLPYDYDKADISMINRYIKQAIYADKLNKFDFSRHQSVFLANGGKLDAKYKSSLIMAHNQGNTAEHANVGAVVLAARIGSRSGRNKLMIETKDGLPYVCARRQCRHPLGSQSGVCRYRLSRCRNAGDIGKHRRQYSL
ncbi:MAG: hypothetical protein ACLU99_04135 [Alphaproteobacteria bacterium]